MYRIHIDAYCITEETADLLRNVAMDVSLIRSGFNISMGGKDSFLSVHAEKATPTGDVLVLEVGDDPQKAMADIEAVFPVLAPSTAIIVLGRVNSIPFNDELLDGGVTEYMLLPTVPNAFVQRLGRIFQDDDRGMSGKGRVISLFGAKGGVGTSTIAHNLAFSLQKLKSKPVSLVDMDIHFGTVSINLNQDPRAGIRDALTRAATGLENLDPSYIERFYNKENESSPNLWTLASNPSLYDSSGMFTLENVQHIMDIVSTQASYVVVDLPQVWNPAIANLLSISHETVIVCDHSIQSLRNASMLFENLSPSKPQNTYMKYVLNYGGLASMHDLAPKDFAEALGLNPSVVIPWNVKAFRLSSSEGKLIGNVPGQSKLNKLFDDLAVAVSGDALDETKTKSETKKSGSIFGKIFAKK